MCRPGTGIQCMMSKYNDVILINVTLPVKGLITKDAKTSNSIHTILYVKMRNAYIRDNDSSYI